MTRNGKIARLPKAIREELNRRLDEGATGRSLITWLNGLPEVQALMKERFGGAEIREQNLSEWKKGGYPEWVRHQEAMALAERLYERAEEMKAQGEKQMPMNEVLSLWLAARYAVATEEIAETESEEGWKRLRQICGDVAKLRRLDQQAEKLELEAERIELQREKVKIDRDRWKVEKPVKKAEARTAKQHEEEERKSRSCLTAEERRQKIAQIYGLDPDWEPGRK